WMVEPEIAFAELGDVMNLTEDMLKYAMKYVLEHAPEEMEFFNSFVDKTVLERMNNVINSDFGRITYTYFIAYFSISSVRFITSPSSANAIS
ncbi:asparagine--tRNA ligase, partial [Bacillus sp. D-CC]